MDKRFVAILAVIILVFGGFLIFGGKSSNSSSGSNSSSSSKTPSNNVMGENKKNVVLMEYGDYQCPACGQYYPIVKQVVDKYKSDIKFQFRNFPLTSIHPNAFAGARAAEAAAKQGKFWEMHDQLYEGQNTWSTSSNPKQYFDEYAKAIGLDMAKFNSDFTGTAVNDTINADIAEGQKIGANSTPTFVINGKKVEENPRGVDEFSKLIDEAIAQQSGSSSSTSKP